MPSKRNQPRPTATSIPIGQLIILGFDGTEFSPAHASLLQRIQPAGVILFARNIHNAQQTHRLLRECQSNVTTPLFTCVDLEGGKVDRFRDVLGHAPAPAEVFATGNRTLFHKHGQIIGENCRVLGFNVDFAPALDLAFEASRSVLNSRAVSEDPRQVVIYAREFLAGLADAGVLGCGKHFPGLGEGKLDSHHALPVIEKSWRALWEQDLAPYRALRAKLPFVMVSHAAYPGVTKQPTPASLSPTWISGILRKKIGYRGLVASDDLEMGGVLSAAPIDEAAVQFVRAGGDLCLICHKEEGIVRSFEALTKEAERDRRFAARASDSARRILRHKAKWGHTLQGNRSAPSEIKVNRLSRRLWEFSEQVRVAGFSAQENA